MVCEAQRVCAVSDAARAAGIQLGMRRNTVLLLCAEAQLKERDWVREQAGLQQLALTLLQYSPKVCLSPEYAHIVLVEVAASLRLFAGLQRLYQRIKSDVRGLGFSAHVGIAPNANAACLFALAQKKGRARRTLHLCLRPQRLAQHLDTLALKLLPSAAAYLTWFAGIACRSLGELRALPRAGLQRRCGKALVHALDLAYGETCALHHYVSVADEFDLRCELPDRFDKADAIFYFARSLLLQLCGWLSQKQLAVQHFSLSLEHERGRQALPATVMHIHLAQASWQEAHLSRLLKEHLAQLHLNAAVIALRLHAADLQAMQPMSTSLFPEPSGSAEDQTRLIELLVARLGAAQVLQAAPQADHRPEVANHWISVLEKHRITADCSATQSPRPMWLLAQAIALPVHQHRPFYGSALQLLSSAERIEAGWWQAQLVTRDYFIAQNQQHSRYWIYRERIGHSQASQSSQNEEVWYLHGVFG